METVYTINRPPDPENKNGERLFENELLERLSVTSPVHAFLFYVPVMVGVAWWSLSNHYFSHLLNAAAMWVAGFFFWTFAEYITHRFYYHAILKVKILRRVQYLFHGWHHKHPADPKHLFMPALAGWAIILGVGGIFYLLMGRHSLLFTSGFLGGYLSYVFLHYCIHRYAPPFQWLKPWWKHHLMHHYRYPKHAYAVQVIFWDKLFNTMPPAISPLDEKELLKHG